jgi:acetoin utilization deacetylase AcuC-like enzyme
VVTDAAEPAAELLERRWFAAIAAAKRVKAECDALLVVLEISGDAWRRACVQLAKLETLRDMLGDQLVATYEPSAVPAGTAIPYEEMSAAWAAVRRPRFEQPYSGTMKCVYHPSYQVALPPGHPFPMSKYSRLVDQLLAEGTLAAGDILQPEPLDAPTLELVHTPEYLAKLSSSGLSVAEQRRLGLPWSEALWQRARLASAGTLLAARAALDQGLAGNLAGGTHHAFADHGEGFCALNDVAIAIRKLQAEHLIERAAVVDLDVHQGNGTAAIFEADDEVFTFSMHGERNYPLAKMRSNLDVPLEDGVGDAEYLDALQRHLPTVLNAAKADIVFYLAGVDVAAGDRYGKLALTEEGIRRRDRWVIEAVRRRGLPLIIVLAGGYAPTRARTAELHAHAFREAVACAR